jgi:hypothetical protein
MVIADLLNENAKREQKSQKKVFQDFAIENVPKNQYNYQHENTL